MIFDIQNSNIKSGHHQIGVWHAEDILNKKLNISWGIYSLPIFVTLSNSFYQKLIFDIQNSIIKSGHHQISGWHTEDILNKELKYFMRHIFSTHICYPLKLLLPSHKLREPIPSIHSFKTTITNKSVWRKSLVNSLKFLQWLCRPWSYLILQIRRIVKIIKTWVGSIFSIFSLIWYLCFCHLKDTTNEVFECSD